jgi:hypothetical protein
MNRIVLRIGIALALIVAIVAALALRQHGSDPAPAAASDPALRITGTYADDWQGNCGPLTGPDQTACTDRLNAKYGHTEGAPVPEAGQ